MNAHDGSKAPDSDRTASLLINNVQVKMPVRSGSIGPDVIDVGRLYRESGCFTYDPGFTSTASWKRSDMWPPNSNRRSQPGC